jgi:hypothetical protein
MADRLELVDASGPVAPRFAHVTTIVIADLAWTRDHRDARGATHDTGTITRAAWDELVARIGREVSPGTALDLIGDKRGNKGVAPCHVELVAGDVTTRIDYLSSHADADHGDPRVVAIVAAISSARP